MRQFNFITEFVNSLRGRGQDPLGPMPAPLDWRSRSVESKYSHIAFRKELYANLSEGLKKKNIPGLKADYNPSFDHRLATEDQLKEIVKSLAGLIDKDFLAVLRLHVEIFAADPFVDIEKKSELYLQILKADSKEKVLSLSNPGSQSPRCVIEGRKNLDALSPISAIESLKDFDDVKYYQAFYNQMEAAGEEGLVYADLYREFKEKLEGKLSSSTSLQDDREPLMTQPQPLESLLLPEPLTVDPVAKLQGEDEEGSKSTLCCC